MKISFSELEDQVQDGYYVDSMMKCCWAAQMEVLQVIDSICEKYNIKYFAEWGTMLGAVRHQGIIPWDDDVDITMKRPDYNKFLRVVEQELPHGYHVMSYRNDDDYWDVMARVVNTEYISLRDDFLEKYHYFPFSCGIDIFPMDFLPTNKGEAEMLKKVVDEVKGVADSYGQGFLTEDEFQSALDYLEILCNMKIEREGDIRARLYDIVVSLYAIYQEDESEEIALMPLWLENGGQAYPKEYFTDVVRLPFEQITIPVSAAYDAMLKKKYGDYMKMVRVGGSHDYPYYNKQVKIAEEYGISFPKYEYSSRVIREDKVQNKKADLNIEDLLVLENAHMGLFKLLVIQENETAIQLLLKCQDCAISLGNKIEEIAIDCEDLIHSLEEYCEIIFQIYQMLGQGEVLDAEGVFRILQEQLQAIRDEYSKEYDRKQKIVFVVDKASNWRSLESIWKVAEEDKNAIVSVIVVPYFYKKWNGEILEEHYEKDEFPEYVEITDYRTCNLENYHPDVIYINSPYDEFNYIYSIHPRFYSSKLVNYTEKLVYIPWFTMSELTREDERGWQSMQHFVTKPGVVNADRVIVQSEQMKEAYVEYLTEWAGEDTRSIWEEKISGMGSPLMDKEDNKEEILDALPEEWKSVLYKEDGNWKKVLLYSISATGFVERGLKAAEKLQSVLQLLKENSEDIAMVWYSNKEIEAVLKLSHPDLWEAYYEIVEKYRKEGWGIYAENLDSVTAVLMSDAYYGDACALSQDMVIAEKPVMIQNFEC